MIESYSQDEIFFATNERDEYLTLNTDEIDTLVSSVEEKLFNPRSLVSIVEATKADGNDTIRLSGSYIDKFENILGEAAPVVNKIDYTVMEQEEGAIRKVIRVDISQFVNAPPPKSHERAEITMHVAQDSATTSGENDYRVYQYAEVEARLKEKPVTEPFHEVYKIYTYAGGTRQAFIEHIDLTADENGSGYIERPMTKFDAAALENQIEKLLVL